MIYYLMKWTKEEPDTLTQSSLSSLSLILYFSLYLIYPQIKRERILIDYFL